MQHLGNSDGPHLANGRRADETPVRDDLIGALALVSAVPAFAPSPGRRPTAFHPTPSNRNVVIDHWKFTPKDLVILLGTTVVA